MKNYDIRFLVLQTDVQRQYKRIFDAFGHVGMSGTVIHNETTNKLRLGCGSMLHFHDLDHVKINGFSILIFCVYPGECESVR